MADASLITLAKHCRREAAADMARIAKAGHRTQAATDIARRRALWLQIADEIDAYLGGNLDEPVDDPNQLALETP